jgi:hypothetical protein
MIGVCNYFSSLKEEEIDLYIEMGNNAKCPAVGHGTVTFQRESEKPLMVKDVLYVSEMTKNLISVLALEDMVTWSRSRMGECTFDPRNSRQPK